MSSTEASIKMAEKIKKSIAHDVISACDYEDIMMMANADGYINRYEKALLKELNNLITDGMVKFVPCER